MPYSFRFDLSRISKAFFREIASIANKKSLHRRLGGQARHLADKFHLHEITGLEVSDALMLVEDLVDIYVKNISQRDKFHSTKKRALFLPHCARKYMDNKCESKFDPTIPSYSCNQCSKDCLINKSTTLAKELGYEVFVVAGGSCIPEILRKNGFEGAVGVACSEELKMAVNFMHSLGLSGQAIPLTKNGCANTRFNFRTLKKILSNS